MDTSKEFRQILEKKQTGSPINVREAAVAIANDEETLLKYMADNDPSQLYRLLHQSEAEMFIGKNAAFIPDKKRVEGELKLLLVKKDFKTLNDVVSAFRIDRDTMNYTNDSKLIKALEDIKAINFENGTYAFNVRFQE